MILLALLSAALGILEFAACLHQHVAHLLALRLCRPPGLDKLVLRRICLPGLCLQSLRELGQLGLQRPLAVLEGVDSPLVRIGALCCKRLGRLRLLQFLL